MSYSIEELAKFQELYEKNMAMIAENSYANIAKHSLFTRRINWYIANLKELRIYQQLNLREETVTRPALIMNIDPHYCTPTGETNAQRMAQGKAPYDVATGSVIDLHHIGQRSDSPFAELPHSIHDAPGITSTLHRSRTPSWRNDPELLKEYQKETITYWKQRGEAV